MQMGNWALQLTQDSVASNMRNTISACIEVNNYIAALLRDTRNLQADSRAGSSLGASTIIFVFQAVIPLDYTELLSNQLESKLMTF